MSFLLFVIGFTGLIVWNARLSNRIEELEILQGIKKSPLDFDALAAEKPSPLENKSKHRVSEMVMDLEPNAKKLAQKIESIIPKTEKDFSFEDFLGRKFFAILGVISIVLAIGFFVTWAFSHGWIGPKGRIALGILASLAIVVFGEFLRPKYPNFYDKVSAAGIAGLLIVTFLARNYYQFLTPGQSFLAYIFEIAIGLIFALKNDSRFLGNFSILGALIAPLLTNPPEPDPVGLLWYLVILAIGGFIVSLYKKWPEILGSLFLGILGFETSIYFSEMQTLTFGTVDPSHQWLHLSPLSFLIFVFGLHALMGSGGIIRAVREKISQTASEKLSGTSTFEILLFIFAVFSANFFGGAIFENQNWSHFGFFVLAEGFLFFALAEVFRKQNLSAFQTISIAATLISILFATIWEIGTENIFMVSIFWVTEAALFAFAGQKSGQRVFDVFGKIALILAFFAIFNVDDFAERSLAVLAFVLGTVFAVGAPKTLWEKISGGFGLLAAVIHIFAWSFDRLEQILPEELKFLPFLLPVISGVGLCFSVIKTRTIFSRIAGGILLGVVNLVLWGEISDYDWLLRSSAIDPSFIYVPFLALLMVLAGNFSALATFFIDDRELEVSVSTQKIAAILVLGISTLGVMLFGGQILEEPMQSLCFIFWGGILLGFGFSQNWPHFRYFGIGIFLFLIAKWFLVDIWHFEVWVRFLAFLALGAALLGISFLYSKNKEN